MNYGAIGAVIGHEISHGFDDQGSKYDGKGVFQDWWTEADRANFDKRTAMLVAQYDASRRCPACMSSARTRWARTSPTMPAWPSR